MPLTRRQLHEAEKEKSKVILSQPQSEPCFICSCSMDDESPPCCVSGCQHIVCAICIREWGQRSNRCPFCRARFTFAFYLEGGDMKEIKFRTRNDVDYDYDVESTEQQTHFMCNICDRPENIASMIMCTSRDCSYTAHTSCLQLRGIPVGDENSFQCPTHTPASLATARSTAEPVAQSAPIGAQTSAPTLPPAARIGAPSAPPPDPFATRVVRKPNFSAAEQVDRPYYLDMHSSEDANEGLRELKRRREEVSVVRAQRAIPQPVVVSQASRLSDRQLYDRVFRASMDNFEQRRRVHHCGPEFDSFGNILTQRSDKRRQALAASEAKARELAEIAARAAVKARSDTEKGAEAVADTRGKFLQQQREAVALEKLRALIAAKRHQ